DLGQELCVAATDLARLSYWLGNVLQWQWQRRSEDVLRVGHQGLALLGDESDVVEAALLGGVVGTAYAQLGRLREYRTIMSRVASLLLRLPYATDLRIMYTRAIIFHLTERRVDEALACARHLEMLVQHHTQDLAVVATVALEYGAILLATGDVEQARRHL